ncbi:MAG: TIGR03936 family radical SAM-associated protein [Candidatus Omnitrophica bacterium]|nr:TIGR03936 family radical SAM-associated protein [Candidatus Omnitrophota bacterium]
MVYIAHFKFYKRGKIKYISHLDLVRLFARAARRAGLPLYLTKGFSPRPKIVFKRALRLGLESDNEECSIYLNEPIRADEFKGKLNACLPEGVNVLEVFGINRK